jgi:hypothetical protein
MNSKKKSLRVIAFLILTLLINSCRPAIPSPSPTSTQKPTLEIPSQTVTATQKLIVIPSSTVTLTPVPSPTATSTPSATIPPGPNIDIFYLADGAVYRFNLQSWTAEKLELSDSEIREATISPDQQFLAFIDPSGLHISKKPFTMPVSTIPMVGDGGALVISNDNHLAFSDQEGLKIYNIQTRAMTLLKSHTQQPFVLQRISFYFSSKWSPDSKWLWMRNQHYEDAPPTLFNIISGTEYSFSSCTSDIDWSADSQTFVTTVFYSGYYGCGADNGVFVANITADNLAIEKVYSEGKEGGVLIDAILNWSGNKIVFVQKTFQNDPTLYRLLLWDTVTKQIKELDSGSHKITTPKWSVDGDMLFYIGQIGQEIGLISLDLRTFEKKIISNLAETIEITSVLSEPDWLLLRIINDYPNFDNLLLINAFDGRQKVLSNIFEHQWIDWDQVMNGIRK